MIEFRVSDDSPVEVSDKHQEISAKGRKRFIVDGGRAFEVWRGRHRERLLTAYEQEQRLLMVKRVTTVSSEPLRQTIVPVEARPRETLPQQITEPPVIDEQAEAKQFYEAVAVDDNGEPWVPDYRDWYSARLKFAVPEKHFLVGELDNGDEVWVSERDISRSPAHTLCLPEGTEIFVRLELNTNHNYRYRALECQIDGETKEANATGELTHWPGTTFGSARMAPCGCNIFVMASRFEEPDLNVGDVVEFDIVLSTNTKRYIGINARKRTPQLAPGERDV